MPCHARPSREPFVANSRKPCQERARGDPAKPTGKWKSPTPPAPFPCQKWQLLRGSLCTDHETAANISRVFACRRNALTTCGSMFDSLFGQWRRGCGNNRKSAGPCCSRWQLQNITVSGGLAAAQRQRYFSRSRGSRRRRIRSFKRCNSYLHSINGQPAVSANCSRSLGRRRGFGRSYGVGIVLAKRA